MADTSDKLFAYTLVGGARDSARDITLENGVNDHPAGIWSNDTSIWVADTVDDKLYAYTLVGGARDAARDITLGAGNQDPSDIWSNDTTIWVVDTADDKLYAYTLAGGARDAGRDFDTLSAADNHDAFGIWSDGTTMWVSDDDDKVFAYNMPPPSDDATLSELTVGSRVVFGIDQNQPAYQVGVGPDVGEVTVTPVTSDAGASWLVTSPADADSNADGHQVALSAGGNTVTVRVTAEDGTTKDYTVSVNRGVADAGGWQAGADLDGLIAAGMTNQQGVWSDGTTMWVANFLAISNNDKLYAFALSDGTRDAAKDIDLHDDNTAPFGIWSNRTTMWVVDAAEGKLFAYKMSDGSRRADKEIDLHDDNAYPAGVWSDGTTVWVVNSSINNVNEKLYAYLLSDGARDAAKDIDLAGNNAHPWGLWSDETTIWVADINANQVFAYLLSDGSRDADRDITLVPQPSPAIFDNSYNDDPRGVWSDGATMWVVEWRNLKVFAYNLPRSGDALVSNLTSSDSRIAGRRGFAVAQRVDTGSVSAGNNVFEVSEIGFELYAAKGRSAVATIRDDNGGEPGEVVATLNSPSTFVDEAVNWFTARSGETVRLDPDETYWFALEKDPQGAQFVQNMATLTASGTSDYDWDVFDKYYYKDTSSGTWERDASSRLRLEVRGGEAFYEAPSDDATLSELTVSPKNIIGFDADRTDYGRGGGPKCRGSHCDGCRQ